MDDSIFISARNKSTYAHTYENQYLVDLTLSDHEGKLAKESVAQGPSRDTITRNSLT